MYALNIVSLRPRPLLYFSPMGGWGKSQMDLLASMFQLVKGQGKGGRKGGGGAAAGGVRHVGLTLTPASWSGKGLLGCTLK